jgi:hypothetical protein
VVVVNAASSSYQPVRAGLRWNVKLSSGLPLVEALTETESVALCFDASTTVTEHVPALAGVTSSVLVTIFSVAIPVQPDAV